MPGKDPSAELVALALPQNSHAGPLEPEVEASGGMPEKRLPTVRGAFSDIRRHLPSRRR